MKKVSFIISLLSMGTFGWMLHIYLFKGLHAPFLILAILNLSCGIYNMAKALRKEN